MKLLWIVNKLMPEAAEALGQSRALTGGWLESLLDHLRKERSYEIAVASIYHGKDLKQITVNDVKYFLIPSHGKAAHRYNKSLEAHWNEVKATFRPDVIHIHGTEFPHGLAWVNACGSKGAVVSIQGLISEIATHYCDGLNKFLHTATLRDRLKGDSMVNQQRKFHQRGRYETELLKSVSHIVGRTDWDHAWTSAINPDASYHYCGEILRPSFYTHLWSYQGCQPHSLFVSQATYPVKGLHMLLEAMPLILCRYPDAQLRVGGADITRAPWYRKTGYARVIEKLIKKHSLGNHIEFLGQLDEPSMLASMLRANVFVCPSTIENSSNSIGEAQLLRMPHVDSFVGGTPDIVNYNSKVLYRFSDVAMLAERVCQVFEAGNAVEVPSFDIERYSPEKNLSLLTNIYHTIYNDTDS